MRGFTRKLAGLGLGLVLVAACGDDDNGNNPSGPATPTGLTVVANGAEDAAVLTWNASSGATSYLVERSTAPCGAYTQLSEVTGATTYTDESIEIDEEYCFRVAARNTDGTSNFTTPVEFSINGPMVATLTSVTTSRILYSDTLYILSGYVKVSSGATLTIQAGTRIVGDTTTPGASLWILRGAKIEANGTSANPIVFTSQREAGDRKPGDWGGIIIIGNGIINRTGTIQTEGPAGVAEIYSGGNDNTDNSGTMRYVRIEYAGYDISGGNASELNGLSLYAVGSGTTLEYIEVLNGLDDSFEWWGGAVDGRYLVSYNSGDDHFDWSEGYVGRNQFLIGFQQARLQPAPGSGTIATDPQGFEADGCNGSGCTLGFRSTPFADPIFANVTLVGMGATEIQAAGGYGAVLRRGTKGRITNGIIANWKGSALTVRDSVTGNILAADSLNVTDMVFAANAADYDAVGTNFGQATAFAADNHRTAATVAAIITSVTPAALNWIPLGTAATGCGTVALPAGRTGSFFGGTLATTAYCGAQDPAGAQWTAGWTVYNEN